MRSEKDWRKKRSGFLQNRRANRSEKVKLFEEGEIVRRRRSKVCFFETPVLRSYQGMDLGFFYANAFALKLVCWYALVCCFYTRLSVECAF